VALETGVGANPAAAMMPLFTPVASNHGGPGGTERDIGDVAHLTAGRPPRLDRFESDAEIHGCE
jgi:hypothetical protein